MPVRVGGAAIALLSAAVCSVACDGALDVDRGVTLRVRAIRPVTHDGRTVIIGRPSDAISLDPARVSDNESVEVCEQIYDKLLDYVPGTNEVAPGLATSWEVSDDGKSWTFRLRSGVQFHDGTPLDADAVVFSFERQRDPSHPFHRDDFQYWGGAYGYIQRIEAVDRHTVRIILDEPHAPFLADMAVFPVAIVSPTAVRTYGDDYGSHPVGTGPFRLAQWAPDERIVLDANDDYWGGAPQIRRLVFQAIPAARQRLVGLESGTIDIAYSIQPEELQFVQLHPDLALRSAPANNVSYLALNTTHAPFDDVRVRRAANLAINVDPIVKLLYQGQALVAHGAIPPTQWGYHPLPEPYAYDPAAARELLAESTADGRFDPTRVHSLYVSSTPRPYLPDPIAIARAVQVNLDAVGIRTQLVVQPFDAHLHDVRAGEHDLCLQGWVSDNGDPDNYLYVLFGAASAVPGLARNLAFFRDPRLDEWLLEARRSGDRRARERAYAHAQEFIHTQAPWVPLAHSQVNVAARIDLRGIALRPNGLIDYRGVNRR